MKGIIKIILSITLVIVLAACSSSEEEAESDAIYGETLTADMIDTSLDNDELTQEETLLRSLDRELGEFVDIEHEEGTNQFDIYLKDENLMEAYTNKLSSEDNEKRLQFEREIKDFTGVWQDYIVVVWHPHESGLLFSSMVGTINE